MPLGDIDEEALAFSEEAESDELLPAIEPLRRRLVLAKLVLQWTRQLASAAGPTDPLVAATPAAAMALADQLAHLFDDITLANIPFEKIGEAAPGVRPSVTEGRAFLPQQFALRGDVGSSLA